MNTRSIEERITALEARRQHGDTIPEWWADVPADLKRDVIWMGEMVEAACETSGFLRSYGGRMAAGMSRISAYWQQIL